MFYTFVNHSEKRKGRTYALWLQEDLFGQLTVVRLYGSANREPVLRSRVVASREEGQKLLARLVRLRERHGYVAQQAGRRCPSDKLRTSPEPDEG